MMRIDANYRFPASPQRKTQNNDLLFESVLKDAAKQEEENKRIKKGSSLLLAKAHISGNISSDPMAAECC
ncbi:hypothetical protein L5D93_27265 [Paenibacillus thiaminolyticus]|nr:hypothetical protein [Paenibacillus thiaminolyticus]